MDDEIWERKKALKSYVFLPTDTYDKITAISEKYLDLYKKLGVDAPNIMKFSGGNNSTVITDKPSNKTVIQPSMVQKNSIIAITNEMLISGYKTDIRYSLKHIEQKDSKRKKIEKAELKKARHELSKHCFEMFLQRLRAHRRAKKIKDEHLPDQADTPLKSEAVTLQSDEVGTFDTLTL